MFDDGGTSATGTPGGSTHEGSHARAGRSRRQLWLIVAVVVAAVVATVVVWALLVRGDDAVQAAPVPVSTPTPSPTTPPPAPDPTPTPSPALVTAATESVTSVPEPEQVVDSSMTLDLPTLGTTAPVIEVGVTEDLVLQVPSDPAVLGRWSDGARVGDGSGTIALVGHVSYRGELGVLHQLPNLRPGDEAVVTTPEGTVRYVAERVDVYNKQALPYQDIFRFDVSERLVLITCGGEFDRSTGHYDSNVVAYLTPA